MNTKIKNTKFVTLIDKSNLEYIQSLNGESRKNIGQIFTPASIAEYMANLFIFKNDTISILDPGAGTGILTAAICDRLITFKKPLKIKIDAFENDYRIIPYLMKNLSLMKQEFLLKKHYFEYNIIKDDFIRYNSDYFNSDNLFFNNEEKKYYDFVIANPPYFKLPKSHPQSMLMKNIVHGQPNIYFFFMALSAKLLNEKGQLVVITPRSYCSGLYFKKFRKWFLEKIKPEHIHIFESRKETFNNEVLQETIILKGIKQRNKPKSITISVSYNADLNNSKKIKANYENVIQSDDLEQIIHIPTNHLDLKILHIVRSWEKKFTDLGYRISTGPIVSFRAMQYLNNDVVFDGKNKVPLLWMNHIKSYKINYPDRKLSKPQTIDVCTKSVKLLLKNKNYVLVKRFSSKEQKKRIYAAQYSKEDFKVDYIGIENHLNYIWKPIGELSKIESLGIMAILNSSLIDKYFRIINGNTQVNASEINSLPFPSYTKIIEIGKDIETLKTINDNSINSLVINKLGISKKIGELLL